MRVARQSRTKHIVFEQCTNIYQHTVIHTWFASAWYACLRSINGISSSGGGTRFKPNGRDAHSFLNNVYTRINIYTTLTRMCMHLVTIHSFKRCTRRLVYFWILGIARESSEDQTNFQASHKM